MQDAATRVFSRSVARATGHTASGESGEEQSPGVARLAEAAGAD